ncbi:hypothetical protein BD289DRAFT_371797 [Coniella lustricola]|uniref:MACPF domain-containing protein n=1 Tax=Coniella lustricola TaxID=2025994 RepID=A0A2T3A384_9PEZI|nr:hypothetical protein BD289DRAFT_371797 [Coniella lustricola]
MAPDSHARIQDQDFADWLQLEQEDGNWITQQAALGVPIVLPWKREAVRLGTCFKSSLQSTKPWLSENPFILSDLHMIPKVLRSEYGSTSSFHSINTTQKSETGNHLSLGFGVGVGTPYLASASVKGTYDEEVQKNKDSDKSSIRASVRCATVELDRNPRLSHEAMAMLKYGGGYEVFTERYGDYFVWGYRLGGDTGLLISSSSFTDKKVDSYTIKGTVTVLGISKSKSWTKDIKSFSTGKSMKLVGYDTLGNANWKVTTSDEGGLPKLLEVADTVILNSQNILERTLKILEGQNMADGEMMSVEQCDFLTKNGVAVELVLLPMAAMRDVARWTTEHDVI